MTEKLMTPEFRASFVHLVNPKAMKVAPGQPAATPEYQMLVALPSTDPFWNQASAAVAATATARWGEVPPRLKSPIKDGNSSGYDNLVGHYLFNARNERKPGIVGPDLQPIMDPQKLYSGAWYRATVVPYAWDHPTGGKGVSFSLSNVMWVRDDEPFDGSTSAEEDFKGFAQAPVAAAPGGSMLPGAAAPVAPAAPVDPLTGLPLQV